MRACSHLRRRRHLQIDRVTFGLLSTAEHEALLANEPHMPRSRVKLAIPFLGKDCPSRASEFAHPDVLIGLTVLAYRYEGLRQSEFRTDVIGLLRSNFESELGAYSKRPSSELYESWVTQAGGIVKGAVRPQPAATLSAEDEEKIVVPLFLLKQSNEEQMDRLHALLCKSPATIHWYLEQVIFPTYTQQQRVKLSSSGQELGGSMLFSRRIGFSGTPSDLLPLDLGRCGYEKGSDGKMVHILCSPEVVEVEHAPEGWSAESLLTAVATADPRYHALIDTGALITGLSNHDVASWLLKHGLSSWCEGVVYLDEHDEKRILIAATGRSTLLTQCGIADEKRFTFYDQVHTTGMDIKQCFAARAVLTLGKDMVFRDLAQGAFRMRGIGAGQRLTIVVIPEVAQLIARQLEAAGRAPLRDRAAARPLSQQQQISAWLVINAMKTESVQANQLAAQNLADIWRQNAWKSLTEHHGAFAANEADLHERVTELLGDQFYSVTAAAMPTLLSLPPPYPHTSHLLSLSPLPSLPAVAVHGERQAARGEVDRTAVR